MRYTVSPPNAAGYATPTISIAADDSYEAAVTAARRIAARIHGRSWGVRSVVQIGCWPVTDQTNWQVTVCGPERHGVRESQRYNLSTWLDD